VIAAGGKSPSGHRFARPPPHCVRRLFEAAKGRRQKGSPPCGELAEPARPEGLFPFAV